MKNRFFFLFDGIVRSSPLIAPKSRAVSHLPHDIMSRLINGKGDADVQSKGIFRKGISRNYGRISRGIGGRVCAVGNKHGRSCLICRYFACRSGRTSGECGNFHRQSYSQHSAGNSWQRNRQNFRNGNNHYNQTFCRYEKFSENVRDQHGGRGFSVGCGGLRDNRGAVL